jgi:hypothetical protein
MPAGDIRQDLAAFDGTFRLPAARIQVVTTLAGAGSPWKAAEEEVQDTEIVHTVAPAAALRVVLLPSNALASTANATAERRAARGDAGQQALQLPDGPGPPVSDLLRGVRSRWPSSSAG